MPPVTPKLPETETPVDAPVEAFRFAANFAPGQSAEDGTVPFTTLARTAQPVEHWYWGACIHDFSGLNMAPVIPVDYAHSDAEALGLINARAITPEGLQLSGLLTPYKEGDKASEVIFKSGKGVPYQASVFFDPWSCVVEDVPAGFTTEVNGQAFAGPIAVFRQWELKGLALCMYGVDSGTNVMFSKDLSGKTVAVTRFKKGEEMNTKTPVKSPTKATGKFAEGEKTEEEKKAEGEQADGEEKETETTTTTETETESTTGDEKKSEEGEQSEEGDETKMSRKDLGKKFIGAFGELHGPALFAKGYTFSQANTEFTKILKAENKALREENARFKQSNGAKPNGTTPVSFGGNSGQQTNFGGLSGGAAKFASGITIPAKKK